MIEKILVRGGIFVLFMSLLVVSVCLAQESKGMGIIAEGLAVIRDNNTSRARETAINDALGLALDQYIGEKIKGPEAKGGIFKGGYAIAESRIQSKAKEVIDSYEILDEAHYENIYWVKLKVYFKEDAISKQGLDKIRVVVGTEESVKEENVTLSSNFSKTGVTESLADSGLEVIEPKISLDSLWTDTGVKNLVAEKDLDVDLIILVKMQSRAMEKFGDFYAFKSNANVRVIKPYTKEVIATTSISTVGERSLDKNEALENSLLACGREAGKYVIDKIVKKAESIISYQVVITGLKKRVWLDQIVDSLPTNEGIHKISSTFIAPKLAMLEVELNTTAKEKLSYYLEHLKKINLKVVKESYRRIEAKVR